jgi:WD40 repeat protein
VSIDDLIAGKQKFHIPLKGELTALAFSPDGRMLAALNNRDDVIVWEVLTGKERARFPTARIGYSGRLAFSPDHRYLAVASPVFGEETLRVWDLATNKEVGPFPGHLGAVTNVAFSPNGRCLATASSDGTVLIRAFPGK